MVTVSGRQPKRLAIKGTTTTSGAIAGVLVQPTRWERTHPNYIHPSSLTILTKQNNHLKILTSLILPPNPPPKSSFNSSKILLLLVFSPLTPPPKKKNGLLKHLPVFFEPPGGNPPTHLSPRGIAMSSYTPFHLWCGWCALAVLHLLDACAEATDRCHRVSMPTFGTGGVSGSRGGMRWEVFCWLIGGSVCIYIYIYIYTENAFESGIQERCGFLAFRHRTFFFLEKNDSLQDSGKDFQR